MGYRSEVKSVIYGTSNEVSAFKADNFDLFTKVCEEFGGDIKHIIKDDEEIIYLSQDYVKWYDEYEEVQMWNELLALAQEAGLCTEFVRVGENADGDIEQDYVGVGNMIYLSPRITIDVGFSEV